MKKQIIGLLAVLTIILSGCGSSGSGSDDGPATQTSVAASDAAEEASTVSEETNEETEPFAEEVQPEISFESFTAIDNDECSVIIKSLEPDGFWGYTVKAELENKSTEITYRFAIPSASVNGVETDPIMSAQVAPGKKSLEDIKFMDSTLKDNAIGEFTDIEITFRVHDDNDWMADEVARETVHIYPFGEDKATVFVREPLASDIVLADDDNVTVIVTGFEVDDIWGYTVNLYIVNHTDTEVMFSVDEASINGYMSDPFWAKSVSAGKCAFSSMHWGESKLEEIGISNPEAEIENIEFLLKARDNGSYTADPYIEQMVTLEP